MSDVSRVGCVERNDVHVVRIVHISDTHLLHEHYVANKLIPDGDILVHSGDFAKFNFRRLAAREDDYLGEIKQLNDFFESLPHKYKIFVAGNHETNFSRYSPEQTSRLLTSAIYLQDSFVRIDGIKFYGSPWNGLRHNSFARGFSISYKSLQRYWKLIPEDTDVLITHNPPYNINDLGSNKHFLNVAVYCDLCDEYHKEYKHFGCKKMSDEVLKRIKPKVHLFGHAHEPNGIFWEDGILFSNAALACTPRATVIDYYVEPERKAVMDTVPHHLAPSSNKCIVM